MEKVYLLMVPAINPKEENQSKKWCRNEMVGVFPASYQLRLEGEWLSSLSWAEVMPG